MSLEEEEWGLLMLQHKVFIEWDNGEIVSFLVL
jgi:hypothetical protein